MKGVILGINPSAAIVDLCHEIAPGDIRGASFNLASALPYFPEGSVFLAVVDPSVGTARRAIAARVGGRLIVCPDNGMLTWPMQSLPLEQAVALTNPKMFLSDVSDTFHGRDIFAPVAAHLSNGIPLPDLGDAIEDIETFEIADAVTSDRSIQGEIVYADRFGNLVSSIPKEQVESWLRADAKVRVHVGSGEIHGISRAYADAPRGHPVALFGSVGLLEIAVNGGSAAEFFAVSVGAKVYVHQLPG